MRPSPFRAVRARWSFCLRFVLARAMGYSLVTAAIPLRQWCQCAANERFISMARSRGQLQRGCARVRQSRGLRRSLALLRLRCHMLCLHRQRLMSRPRLWIESGGALGSGCVFVSVRCLRSHLASPSSQPCSLFSLRVEPPIEPRSRAEA